MFKKTNSFRAVALLLLFTTTLWAADTKISALTALSAGDVATDDVFAIVDTSATTTKKITVANLSAYLASLVETLSGKTVDEATISGTPDTAGELGRDTTQKLLNYYDNGIIGRIPRTIAAAAGSDSKTNSTTSDQDFTALVTLPVDYLAANKILRVTVMLRFVPGAGSSATLTPYLKLGSTKGYVPFSGVDLGSTSNVLMTFLIVGRAAPSSSSAVSMSALYQTNNNWVNSLDQPVNYNTGSALDLTFGVTYSATGSTDTVYLHGWTVEELN